MGRTLRNGGNSFQVAIRPLVKTCPEETGINRLTLPNGTKILSVAHAYFPSHDRELHTALRKLLQTEKPDVTIFQGGMIHEEAFKLVVDDADVVTKLTKAHIPSEIEEIMEKHEGIENRFLALGKLCGEYIAQFAADSGGHVYYIPSVTGMLPNEVDIMRFVLEQKERLDAWADRHPDEATRGPDIPEDFAEFLQVHKNPNITVLPWGSALVVNEDTMFLIGDFRRRNPGTAALTEAANHLKYNIVRSFDGKVSSAWITMPGHTFPEPNRRHRHMHEVGNLFDLSKGLGYLRNYDLRAKGIFYGEVVGGKVFGFSVPALEGKNGKRAFVINGRGYEEDAVNAGMRNIALPTPAKLLNKGKAAPSSKAKSAPAASKKKPAAAKATTGKVRKTTVGKKKKS